MRRLLYALGALICAAALTACGGGGGAGSPGAATGGGGAVIPPAPSGTYVQATPAPSVSPVPAGFCSNSASSQLTVSSSPSAAYVEITNPADAGATQLLGQTPLTCDLSPSGNSYTVTVLGNVGQTPQSTVVLPDKANAIYFNAIGDTSGSAQVASGTLSAAARRVSAVVARASGVARRPVVRAGGGPSVVPDQLVVVYRTGALQMEGRSASSVESSLGIAGRAIGALQPGLEWRAVSVPAGQAAALRAQLAARPDVAAVHAVHYRRLQTVTPNDSYFDPYDQWDMYHIDMPDAWTISEGSASVPIAIIDTGYDQTNQDLAARVTHFAVYYSGTGKMTVDPANPDDPANIEDTDGHGTNVAGIAGAITDNGVGFAGVTWTDPLFVYKIFPDTDSNGVYCIEPNANVSDCSALTSDEAAAIYDAVAHGAKVINLSLGSLGAPDQTEEAAVEYAIQHGVAVVAAAGNDGATSGIDYPGGYPGVISVGASAIHGDDCTTGNHPNCNASSGTEGLASYSDYGSSPAGPTLVAPGGDPSGTSDPDDLHWIFNLYSNAVPASTGEACNPANTHGVCAAFFAGTSQATPHVTGAVALMLSANSSLTPAQVYSILSNPSNDDNLNVAGQGAGRLNVDKALLAATGSSGAQSFASAPPITYFTAFAYTPGAGNAPQILDQQYPQGVPVNPDGSFRLSDIKAGASYEVGVWLDTNHDGKVDQGDWFGVAGSAAAPNQYTSSGSYASGYGTISVQQVGANFVLH